jgi:gluconate 5-dehydrogenase
MIENIESLYSNSTASDWAKLLSHIVAAYGFYIVLSKLFMSEKRTTLIPVKRPHIVVTGAARGLGEMILQELFKTGEEMIITGVDLSWEAEEIKVPNNVKLIKLSADLSEEQNVRDLWAKIVTTGPVHLLINNAGVAKKKLFKELEFKSYVHTFKTNLFAPVLLTKLFL